MKILIKNGYVIDMVSEKKTITPMDVLIENKRIKRIRENVDEQVDKIIDATRKSCYARTYKPDIIMLRCPFLEDIRMIWNCKTGFLKLYGQ